MDARIARSRLDGADAHRALFGAGPLLSTLAVRSRRTLDVAFLLDSLDGGFQIGMGAASADFSTVLSIGVDSQDGALRSSGSWLHQGRRISVPVRVLYRSPSAVVVEAGALPLEQRPAALKCWSFLRTAGDEHYADVTGFVSPELAALPPVPIKTWARGGR